MNNNINEINDVNNTTINEIKKIIDKNKLYRFTNELNKCEEETKKKVLNDIINKINNVVDIKPIAESNKLNDFLTKMTNSKYKQSWTKLNKDQKIFKLEEYINNNNDIINKKEFFNKIKNLLNNNKLNSSKEIIYDKNNSKVIVIKNLENIL